MAKNLIKDCRFSTLNTYEAIRTPLLGNNLHVEYVIVCAYEGAVMLRFG